LESTTHHGHVAYYPLSNAQNYPTKPVHFVVAFTAGSGTDIIAKPSAM
jgi:tripartite-type tricarboxylate transporter receptor subunit TctC